MELRKARPEDAPAIATLGAGSQRSEGTTPVVVAALEDGPVVGVVEVETRPGRETAVLRWLAVDPAHRRQGYGRRLLVCGQRLATQAGCSIRHPTPRVRC